MNGASVALLHPLLPAEWIAPSRTALVIVDMQVDFAAADGALGRLGVDLSAVPAALAAAERLAVAARVAGVAVIFVGLQTSPETDSPAWTERMRRRGAVGDEALCRIGERGADFIGPQLESGDSVVAKTRYSGFFGTDLGARLAASGTDTVVICGLTTECCVDATACDAFQLGYHVFVAADACAAYEPDLHVAALRRLALNCAIVVSVDQVAAGWELPRPPSRR